MGWCYAQVHSYKVGALVVVFRNKGRQWRWGLEEWDTPREGMKTQSMRDRGGFGSG